MPGTVDIELALFSLFVQKLFLLPVFFAAILCSRCRPTSEVVGSDTSESGLVENVGAAVEIASPSLSVQKLFPFPVCIVAILSSDVARCRDMSAIPNLGRVW